MLLEERPERGQRNAGRRAHVLARLGTAPEVRRQPPAAGGEAHEDFFERARPARRILPTPASDVVGDSLPPRPSAMRWAVRAGILLLGMAITFPIGWWLRSSDTAGKDGGGASGTPVTTSAGAPRTDAGTAPGQLADKELAHGADDDDDADKSDRHDEAGKADGASATKPDDGARPVQQGAPAGHGVKVADGSKPARDDDGSHTRTDAPPAGTPGGDGSAQGASSPRNPDPAGSGGKPKEREPKADPEQERERNYAKHLKQGERYTRSGQFPKAIRAYKAALAEKPNSSAAHLGLGNAYYELNTLDAALNHLEKAKSLSGRDPQVFLLLGAVYQSAGRSKDAIGAYERYLQLAPRGKFARDVKAILGALKAQGG